MKLLTFTLKKEQNLRVGAFKNENIVDLSEVDLPTDMVEFIDLGDTGIDKATDYIAVSYTHLTLPTILLV